MWISTTSLEPALSRRRTLRCWGNMIVCASEVVLWFSCLRRFWFIIMWISTTSLEPSLSGDGRWDAEGLWSFAVLRYSCMGKLSLYMIGPFRTACDLKHYDSRLVFNFQLFCILCVLFWRSNSIPYSLATARASSFGSFRLLRRRCLAFIFCHGSIQIFVKTLSVFAVYNSQRSHFLRRRSTNNHHRKAEDLPSRSL